MKEIIIKSKSELQDIILASIELYGKDCGLNHLKFSRVNDLSALFQNIDFQGDISQWNTSHVINMTGMFENSTFNGDISNWNVANVRTFKNMFAGSEFNQDISKWNVGKMSNAEDMFKNSAFSHDVSIWEPIQIKNRKNMFKGSKVQKLPFWLDETITDMEQAIKSHKMYQLVLEQVPEKEQADKNTPKQFKI